MIRMSINLVLFTFQYLDRFRKNQRALPWSALAFPDETTQEPKDTEIVKWGKKKNDRGTWEISRGDRKKWQVRGLIGSQ